MDFKTIFSLLLYIGTFLWGLYLDSTACKKKNPKKRRFYEIWLYIFLCFGYMVGSDWRGYELEYLAGSDRYNTEPISSFFIQYFHNIIPDYWLFVGLLKCVYLWTVFLVIRKLTDYTSSTVSLLLNLMLMYMLISNPLRFMIAMIFINIALCYFIDGITSHFNWRKVLIIGGLIVLSALSHNSCVLFVVIFPLLFFFKNVTKWNRVILFLVYAVLIILTTNIGAIDEFKNYLNLYFMARGEFQDYSAYAADEESISLVGNMLKIGFFALVLLSRDKVLKAFPNYGGLCYSLTVLYFFLDRVLLVIPSGFRIVIPLCFFYAVYLVFVVKCYYKVGLIFIIYILIAYTRSLFATHVFLPYSNSIYYIFTGHKTYEERNVYNYNEYRNRTGHDIEIQ